MRAFLLLLLVLGASSPASADYSGARRYGGGLASGSYVPPARSISTGTSTTTGLSGGGDLTADRTLSCVDASATSEGCVNTSAQAFAGTKTFNAGIVTTTLAMTGGISGATTGAFSGALSAGSLALSGALTGATTGAFSSSVTVDTLSATTSLQTPILLGPAGNTRLTLTANGSSSYLDAIAAPGGSSVAHILDTKASYGTAGGKLLSIRNFGTEKVYVDQAGGITLSGALAGATTGAFSTSVQTPLLLGPTGMTRLTLAAGSSSTYADSTASPGGTSVAHIFDTAASYATTGGKLLSFRNAGTEKAFIGYDGSLTALGFGFGTFAPSTLGFALSGSSIRAAVASGQSILLGSNGGTNWATVDSTGISTPGAFQSSVASGSNGLSYSVNGARLDLGTGANDYLYSDGSAVNTATTFIINGNLTVSGSQNIQQGAANTGLIVYPRINDGASAVGLKVANQNSLTTAGAQIVAFYSDSGVSTKVAAIDKDGSYLHKGNPTLQTCAAALEGLVSRDGASGVSTAARTRLCLCTSDGGGTPAYAWQNLVSGTVGTSTTCSP